MRTPTTKIHYDRSFKERAVKLSYERNNIKELAQELGVTSERIYKWRSEFARHGDASFDFIFLLRTSAIHANMMALGLSSIQGHGVERLSDEGKRVKELEKTLRNT